MEPSPLQEIRKIRHQISAECGNDPEKVFDYYQTRQAQLKATGKYSFVTKPLVGIPAGLATEQADEPERD